MPKSLTELAPLTPESASSTLSRINCEKLMFTDGNASNFFISSSWISSRVILRVQTSPAHDRDRLFTPLLHRDQGGVELEIEVAGDVGAVVGAADVRHDRLDLGDRADDLAKSGAIRAAS